MIPLWLSLAGAHHTIMTDEGNTFDIVYIPQIKQVKMSAKVNAGQYLSVGFDCTTMIDCDMILFQGEGWDKGIVTDLWSPDYLAPRIDRVQNYQDCRSEVYDGIYEFTCYRDLNTGDVQDGVIRLDEEYPMIWAESKYSSEMIMHSADGVFSIIIPSNGDHHIKVSTLDVSGKYTKLDRWAVHGILMGLAWFGMGIILIGTIRWFRE